MAEAFDQIGAAIEFRRACRIGLERARREEQRIPALHQQADVERERQRVAVDPVLDRLQRAQIGIDRVEIAALDLGVIGIREGRIEMAAVRTPALLHRAREVIGRPASDAGGVVGCDVRRHDLAERRLQREPAGKRLAARRGVTGHAVAGDDQCLAARDVDIIVRPGGRATGHAQRQQQDQVTEPHRIPAHRDTSAPGDFRYLKIASRLQ